MPKRAAVTRKGSLGSSAAGCIQQLAELRSIVRDRLIPESSERSRSRRARTAEYVHRLELLLEEQPQVAVTLSDLAYVLDLERTYCCRIFRDITGKSFSAWMRGIRIRKAQGLLRLSVYSITDISHAVGYADITTFERNFRRELGLSPISFRRSVPDLPS
jgi:transcriptional regulator GlxA family with amidase domain